MKKFVVVYQDESLIMCIAIRDNYDLAVAEDYKFMNECCRGSGEEVKITPMYDLEADTGTGFSFTMGNYKKTIFILEVEEERIL